ALDLQWQAIRDHHLSLGGGPFGGIGHRSREVFNPAGVFDPEAYIETCSVLAWIQLNRELLAITGDVRHAEEIERSAYNDLLGAQAPNGEDWVYYSFANGRRIHTNYWRCCKSSGAMALEELPAVAWAHDERGVVAHPLGPGQARSPLPGGGPAPLRRRAGALPPAGAGAGLGRRRDPGGRRRRAGAGGGRRLRRHRARVGAGRRGGARAADASPRAPPGAPQRAGIARARRLAGAPAGAAQRLARAQPRPAGLRHRTDRRLQAARDRAPARRRRDAADRGTAACGRGRGPGAAPALRGPCAARLR